MEQAALAINTLPTYSVQITRGGNLIYYYLEKDTTRWICFSNRSGLRWCTTLKGYSFAWYSIFRVITRTRSRERYCRGRSYFSCFVKIKLKLKQPRLTQFRLSFLERNKIAFILIRLHLLFPFPIALFLASCGNTEALAFQIFKPANFRAPVDILDMKNLTRRGTNIYD